MWGADVPQSFHDRYTGGALMRRSGRGLRAKACRNCRSDGRLQAKTLSVFRKSLSVLQKSLTVLQKSVSVSISISLLMTANCIVEPPWRHCGRTDARAARTRTDKSSTYTSAWNVTAFFRKHKKKALLSLLITGLLEKSGGLLLSRIALQYHRRRRA